jgi:hypothetical protein
MDVVSPFNQMTGYGKSTIKGFMLNPHSQNITLQTLQAGPGSTVDIIVSESDKPMVEVGIEATYNDPSMMSKIFLCSHGTGKLDIGVSDVLNGKV